MDNSNNANISQVMVNYGQDINLTERFSELCKLNQNIDELIRNDIIVENKEEMFDNTVSSQDYLKEKKSSDIADIIFQNENILEEFTNQIGNINLKVEYIFYPGKFRKSRKDLRRGRMCV